MNSDEVLNLTVKNGVKKAGETAFTRAVNGIIDYIEDQYGKIKIDMGTVFKRYLDNASRRYNQIQTLATGTERREIIGKKSIYVEIGVCYDNREISTASIEPLLEISNNIIISGTGGVGKSMLLRYLFLHTANRGEYIPVLLELRRISNQTPENISIIDLVYASLKDFDIDLPEEKFEYSLRSGKYLFLFDGFDEIKESHIKEAAEAIQKFCSKYPNNPCIMTSRPMIDPIFFETFVTVESMPLNKDQAVELASKIWKEDEKTKTFCDELRNSFYDKYKDFAENPLLLSMMFLTFMRNNSIPEHLADFYAKVYDALYSQHDSTNKGNFKRDFKCKELDERSFKQILLHFCFHSYFDEKYEFTKEEILSYLNKSIKKLGFKNVSAENYLADLYKAVCLIVKDGNIYRYAHRSFQAYFAAVYTTSLNDEQQRRLFNFLFDSRNSFYFNHDYYDLLNQIEPERLVVNALEDKLRDIQEKMNNTEDPEMFLLMFMYYGINILNHNEGISKYVIEAYNYNSYNVIEFFRTYVTKYNPLSIYPHVNENIQYYLDRMRNTNYGSIVTFYEIDHCSEFTDDERQKLYYYIKKEVGVDKIRKKINQWLSDLDKKRDSLESHSFMDDL